MAKVIGTVQRQVVQALGLDPDGDGEGLDWDSLMATVEAHARKVHALHERALQCPETAQQTLEGAFEWLLARSAELDGIRLSLGDMPGFDPAATVAVVQALVTTARAQQGWSTLGCGDGGGQSFVHGSHEAISRCQQAILAQECLTAVCSRLGSLLGIPPDADPRVMVDLLVRRFEAAHQSVDLARLRLAALLDVGEPGAPLEDLATLFKVLEEQLSQRDEDLRANEGAITAIEEALSEFRRADGDTAVELADAAAGAFREAQQDLRTSQDELATSQVLQGDLVRQAQHLREGQRVVLDEQTKKALARLEADLSTAQRELAQERENRARLQGYVDRVLEDDRAREGFAQPVPGSFESRPERGGPVLVCHHNQGGAYDGFRTTR